MHLRTLQGLLVLSALFWALAPVYGVGVFAAAQILCLFSVWLRARAARKLLAPRLEELSKALTPDAVAWVQRFPFWYVWREESREWGTTLKMSSLLMLLLAPWIVIRSLISAEFHLLFLLIPAVIFFFVGVTTGGRLDVDELVNGDHWKKHKGLHEDATRVLSLKETVGQWPPTAGGSDGGSGESHG